MIYSRKRFESFAETALFNVKTLCVSEEGRNILYVEAGEGVRDILITSRHHACESTGSYVLEGFAEAFARAPIKGIRLVCVPFVDFDGVIDRD